MGTPIYKLYGYVRPKWYEFGVWNRVIDFAFLGRNRVWVWQGSMKPHIGSYFDIDMEHSSSKQIEKEEKPRRKVIGLGNAIKDRFK